MEATSTYFAIGIFLIFGTAIAVVAKRFLKKGAKDFYTASGRFGTLLASLSYAATTYSAFMFIGLVGLAYTAGVGALGFELVYFIGTLFLLYFIAPKYWSLHNKSGYITPAEILSDRYKSRLVGAAVTLLALVALIPYCSAQVIGVAVAAEGASGGAVPFTLAVLIAIAVALLWSVIAGIWSIGWTDVFQGIIMLGVGFMVVFWVFSWGYSSVGFNIATLGQLSYVPNQTWSFSYFLSLTMPWFFFAITNPQVVQRLFSPKDKKVLNRMIIWFGVYGFIFTVLVTFLGLMLRGLTINGVFPMITSQDLVTPILLGIMPLWLSVLGLVAVLAASVSTIDGIILTLSSMAVKDILGTYRHSIAEKRGVLAGRIVIAILALACTLFALARPGYIVQLSVLSSSLLLPQVPVVLGMFLWRKGGKVSAVAAIVLGFAVAISLYLLQIAPLGVPANVWTLTTSCAAYIIAALAEKEPSGIEQYFEDRGGEP